MNHRYVQANRRIRRAVRHGDVAQRDWHFRRAYLRTVQFLRRAVAVQP